MSWPICKVTTVIHPPISKVGSYSITISGKMWGISPGNCNSYPCNSYHSSYSSNSPSKFEGSQLLHQHIMQLTSSPHVTKHEMDGGLKSAYYAAILSGKNDHSLCNLSTAKQFASSFLTSTGSEFKLTPRMRKISTGPNSPKQISLPACLVWAVRLQSALLHLYAP